mmetsp:Transcript_81827/g.227918  ORF Transcript_81827/g.227918 Transcript_81827/m.227918 type:complete len:314 (-) Transcript_81827:289-1230(-)|eukprot:CAMPEP_0117527860 /NCGR_PEP_ID=MMETSP0784-20121206/37017_1 /TAXON_ID=39447 /ORGANISM="" /LENGTH=313 /DNA_ID=CAMNT_0005324129 /DNA_START=62 /DNA_END=1003 /DNA_ORIENTATION=-
MMSGLMDMFSGGGPLKDVTEQLQSLQGSVPGVENMPEVKFDAATQVQDQLAGFSGIVTGTINEPEKLLPPGAGCIASCYRSKVEKKLNKFSGEVQGLLNFATEKSEEAKKEFSQLTDKAKSASESLEQVSASIGGALTAIQENMGSPADLLPKFEELESGLNGAIDTTKGILGDLKALAVTAPKNTVTMVEEVLNKVEKFKVSAPKTISKAFSPPCCCCCCGGVSDAQTKLEEGLERVSDLLNLTPLVDGCKNAKDAIKKIDFDGVTKALDDLSEKFTSTLKPAKDFAQKAGGMVPDALRDAAGGEDAPPENE